MSIQDPVSRTARWVAAARAVESRRPDRLFEDPLAERFAGQDGFELLARMPRPGPPPAPGQPPESPYLVIRTRYIDDWIARELADASMRQIVILAAGLDARAYRLAWPADARVFELDRPEVLAFKEREAAAAGARPACPRDAIPVDLRESWGPALVASGFDPSRRALWLVEGLMPYLDESEVHAVVEAVSKLAAPGSRLVGDLPGQTFLTSPWVQEALRSLEELGAAWKFGTDDPEGWFGARGWRASAVRPGDPGASYGRWPFPVPPRGTLGVPQVYLVSATRD